MSLSPLGDCLLFLTFAIQDRTKPLAIGGVEKGNAEIAFDAAVVDDAVVFPKTEGYRQHFFGRDIELHEGRWFNT